MTATSDLVHSRWESIDSPHKNWTKFRGLDSDYSISGAPYYFVKWNNNYEFSPSGRMFGAPRLSTS